MKNKLLSFFAALFLCSVIFGESSALDLSRKLPSIAAQQAATPRARDAAGILPEPLSANEAAKVQLFSQSSEIIDKDAVKAAKISSFKFVLESAVWQSGRISVVQTDEKAEAIIKRAVEKLGGQKYLQVKSVAASGNFTLFVAGQAQTPSSFVDALVFPDKERTEFRQSGVKNVQTNTGLSGWLFDGAEEAIREQSKTQIEDFQRGIRTSLDNLLRGNWKTSGAILSYGGRRQAGVGRRNDVVKLAYPDGFTIEFEFSDDGLPVKSVYKRKNDNGEEIKEEDRYAQFIDIQGIYAPFIIDHFIDDRQTSRVNYLNIQFNKNIPDSIFAKPATVKALKKDLKF